MIMQIPKGQYMSKKELSNRDKAKKALRPSRQTRNTVLFWTLLGGCIAVLAVALFFFFVFSRPSQPSMPEETAALQPTDQAQIQQPVRTPIVTTEPEKTSKPLIMRDSFKELYEQNNDMVGWIRVENTDIDYPIVQADDNLYYMHKDFYKEYSYPGSIFLDFQCDF